MYKTPHRSFMEKELKSKCLKILYAPKTIKEAILMVLKEEGGNLNLTERTGDFFPYISSKKSFYLY